MPGSRGNSYKFDSSRRQSPHAFGRAPATREAMPKLIVAVEGDTEAAYIDEIIRVERERIRVAYIPADRWGSHPHTVVQAAIAKKKEHKSNWLPDKDKVCAVFDGDEHKEGDAGKRERYAQALDLARAHGVHVIITNPSIEFWFLQHFRYTTGAMHRDAAKAEIDKLIPDYRKGIAIYKAHLRALTPTAVENARRLRTHATASGCEPYDNPCTHVDELLLLLFGGMLPEF